MESEKIRRIAEILVDYSTEIKPEDRVLIETSSLAKPLALEIFKQCLERGAYTWINVHFPEEKYFWYKYAKEHQLTWFPEHRMEEIKRADVYVGIRATSNTKMLTNIPSEKITLWEKTLKPIVDWRIEKTRWVIFYYPTEAMAQEAEMSLEELEDFVYNACNINWEELREKMLKLKDLLERTEKVRIVGENTDLFFSIKGRKAVVDDGKHNMPGGEVFTSVIENSVEGRIMFEFPIIYEGKEIDGIILKFKQGMVVDYHADKNLDLLEKILNTDSGARRVGEFGIGINPKINRYIKNAIFDEKIGGTIHIALGRGYPETLSQNESAIHIDLIKDLRKDGEIYFDDVLVFKNGKWVGIE